MSGHVVTSANENWSAAPKKDATRITQHCDSMLSPPTDSGNGGTQLGRHSALSLLAFNSESVARQKINLQETTQMNLLPRFWFSCSPGLELEREVSQIDKLGNLRSSRLRSGSPKTSTQTGSSEVEATKVVAHSFNDKDNSSSALL